MVCSRAWEIDAYREGRLGDKRARSFANHLRGCAACRSQMHRDEELRNRARAWCDDEPDELTLRRLRARVCHDVATGAAPPPSALGAAHVRVRARIAATVAVLLAVAAMAARIVARSEGWSAGRPTAMVAGQALAARIGSSGGSATSMRPLGSPSSERFAGEVLSSQAGRYSQSRELGVEQIRLDDGWIRVHVRPQETGERFFVALPDGEIEVRGTTFDVRVQGGTTARVSVDEGVVVLRLSGRQQLWLSAPQAWDATQPAPLAPPRAHVDLSASDARRTATPPPVPSQDSEASYALAVRLLGEGKSDEAAWAFRAFVQSDRNSDLAEDASFLEAVALARAGRTDAAALIAEEHLAAYPVSFHRKDAAVLVARAAALRGDCARARAVLAPWSDVAEQGTNAELRRALGACPDH